MASSYPPGKPMEDPPTPWTAKLARNGMRWLKASASICSLNPIEVIVGSCIVVTLCYFQLLDAVKHSEFLDVSHAALPSAFFPPKSHNTKPGLTAEYSRSDSTWISRIPSPSEGVVWVSQFEVAGPIEDIIPVFQSTLEQQDYQRICYKKESECFHSILGHSPDLDGVRGFGIAFDSNVDHSTRSEWLTRFVRSLPNETTVNVAMVPLTLTGSTSLVSLALAGYAEGSESSPEPLGEMRSVRWMVYAARAFVLRMWTLARRADSADICVMLVAYVWMHFTFVNLFRNTMKLGSKFWLGTSMLLSSILAFIVALMTAYSLGISINPILLSEALPFLVITVGFDKPYVLSRAIFTNPALARSRGIHPESMSPVSGRKSSSQFLLQPQSKDGAFTPSVRWSPPIRVRDVIVQAVEEQGQTIVRDYAIEIAVLVLGGLTGVHGLQEFCQLAALILVFDCIFLFGFYLSLVTVIVEIYRIKVIKRLKRKDSTTDLTRILDDGKTPSIEAVTAPLTTRQRMIKLFTGLNPGEHAQSAGPSARLKLVLISAFLALHALNMVTTLTANTAIHRHTAHHQESTLDRSLAAILDKRSHKVSAPILNELAKFWSGQGQLVAHVELPLRMKVVPVGTSIDAPTLSVPLGESSGSSSLAMLDRFMSSWTQLVGDPVMSKWIVIALGVSVFLNGYLLKGIATGAASGDGYSPVSAAEEAARILLESTGVMETMQVARTLPTPRRTYDQETVIVSDENGQVKPSRRDSSSSDETEMSNASSPLYVRGNRGRTGTVTAKKMNNVTQPIPMTPTLHGLGADQILTVSHTPAMVGTPSTAPTSLRSSRQASSCDDVEVTDDNSSDDNDDSAPPRPLEECIEIFNSSDEWSSELSDEEVILLCQKGKIAAYALEKVLKDLTRAVRIRRALVSRASSSKTLESSLLPFLHYDYSKVMGQCCENVVGYTPLPIGIAGPLRIDGRTLPIPMATVEGALVASTSRGCKALNAGGGVTTILTGDSMTRGPALEFKSLVSAGKAKAWVDSEEGTLILKSAFNTTSRFARITRLKPTLAGRTMYLRFSVQTGDAMGMNMISKGCEKALEAMSEVFPDMQVLALSGNFCTDKKPAAINWIEGRGKSVVAEGVVAGHIVKTILKTSVGNICKINVSKNLVGSAMAGTMGGNNAHAANIVAAVFLATGQDAAQVGESSNCITLMEPTNGGEDLLITCTMPSIEVGTIGGGTILPPQRAMLEMIGVAGAHPTHPGTNAIQLAKLICASVMAGELSLMSALAAGHLVKSHMVHNRSVPATPAIFTPPISRTPSVLGAKAGLRMAKILPN